MNREQLAKRKRPAPPLKTPDAVESWYRRQLRSLVVAMNKAIGAEILPIIRQEREAYVGDAAPTFDGWAERINRALELAAGQFASQAFESQLERLAREVVVRTDTVTTGAFIESVNKAVGVDLSAIITNEGLNDYLEAALIENVNLIKTIPSQYFSQVRTSVISGMRNGDRPSTIAKRLQELSGVTQRRAAFIARDQVAKLNADIVEARQTNAGITHYRVITSGDERVTGNPAGRYPNAKIKCYEIARRDIGFGPGVYSWKEGAEYAGQKGLHPGKHHPGCRCTSSPVFEWQLPTGNSKKS